MEKERKIPQPIDTRPPYETPHALRLDNGQAGLGQEPRCANPGSGADSCSTGSIAYTICQTTGSTATPGCYYDGSAADGGECLSYGQSAAAGQCVDLGSNAGT